MQSQQNDLLVTVFHIYSQLEGKLSYFSYKHPSLINTPPNFYEGKDGQMLSKLAFKPVKIFFAQIFVPSLSF